MVQTDNAARRSRGRPQVRPDDETRRVLIEAAAQEFQANGYAATSMGAVAQRAGVSTKTLYRLIPAKDDLFDLVLSERIGHFMLDVDDGTLDQLGLDEALERILNAYGRLTLTSETIAIVRLVIGECDRFPGIADSFNEIAIVHTNRILAGWLERQCERGLIRLDDPQMASGMLRGMMIQEPQRAVMLGRRSAPEAQEIADRAKSCTALFLNGCRRQARFPTIGAMSEPQETT